MSWLRHAGGRCIGALIERGIRRRFHEVRVAGAEKTAGLAGPLILCPNHSSWWDGFLCHHLNGLLDGRRLALMQEEKHLERYPWFKLVGVFGIDLDSPAKSLSGVREALCRLEKPETALYLFPQGELRPARGKLEIHDGPAFLAHKSAATVVPVGIRYEPGAESRTFAWVRFGDPLPQSPTTARIQRGLAATLAHLDHDIAHEADAEYEVTSSAGESIHTRWALRR